MWFAPLLAPEYFPASAIDGSSTRALWLQVVGLAQTLVGISFIVTLGVMPAIARWLAAAPALLPRWKNAPVPAHAAPVVAFVDEAAAVSQGAAVANTVFAGGSLVPFPSAHVALAEGSLDEKRFVRFLERLRLLGDRLDARAEGAMPVIFGNEGQHALVHFIKSGRVDFDQLKRSGNGLRNLASSRFLRKIANELDEVVGDTRRAA
ncbi:MAG: hypothetical protein V4773_12185 [Verrucomicrobiota bacterium]